MSAVLATWFDALATQLEPIRLRLIGVLVSLIGLWLLIRLFRPRPLRIPANLSTAVGELPDLSDPDAELESKTQLLDGSFEQALTTEHPLRPRARDSHSPADAPELETLLPKRRLESLTELPNVLDVIAAASPADSAPTTEFAVPDLSDTQSVIPTAVYPNEFGLVLLQERRLQSTDTR